MNHFGGVCEGEKKQETDLIVKKVLHVLLFLGVELQQGCYGTHQLCGLWGREPIKQCLLLFPNGQGQLLPEDNCMTKG